ncbi:MAG: hypothetical protein H6Q07_2265, partial [Acidobacteria bacterium]|nr:hypothetical protein [Acidobacteriota bacterium]
KPLENDQAESFGANNPDKSADIPTKTDKVKERKAEQTKAKESEGENLRAHARETDAFPLPDHAEAKAKKNSRRKTESLCPSGLREGAVMQADTVYLKPDELQHLELEYGADGAERIIALLDAYKTNHPSKCAEYRDDYKVITTWVISRYLEERASPATTGRGKTFIDKLAELAREDKP